MDPRLVAAAAKYGMWVVVELAFVGLFILAVARGQVGSAFFMALCFLLLILVPLGMLRVRGH